MDRRRGRDGSSASWHRLAASVAGWLQTRRRNLQPMVTPQPDTGAHFVDDNWAVAYTPAQLEQLKEVKG